MLGLVQIMRNYSCAASKFDLLVIGYHGHSRIFERAMGSTAQSIVRLAPCPVLVAK